MSVDSGGGAAGSGFGTGRGLSRRAARGRRRGALRPGGHGEEPRAASCPDVSGSRQM